MRPDKVAFHLADVISNATGAPVVFVCDESRGRSDTRSYAKVSMTRERFRMLGFEHLADNWGWFWGDMCYYAAAAEYPDYDAYCLLESDVYMSAAGAERFITRLEAAEFDVLAPRLERQVKPRRYSKPLKKLGLDPRWQCLFPITRMSASAVGAAYDLRMHMCEHFPDLQLNDEGVLVGAVQRNGLSFSPLELLVPDQLIRVIFATSPPYLFESLTAIEGDDLLYHPVYTMEKLLHRIEIEGAEVMRKRLSNLWPMATPQMRDQIVAALAKA
ncbi:MAG: hypothetical protein AAF393_12070 [Pseudomonadota bacterium]